MNMNVAQRIAQLRTVMASRGIDAYLIEGTDSHASEYPPARWEGRKWISGFTGSAGWFALTARHSALWVDGRYHLQAEQETGDSEIELQKVALPGPDEIIPWLVSRLEPGSVVGCNRREITHAQWELYASRLEDAGLQAVLTNDLLDEIWTDRPDIPAEPVREVPLSYTGRSRGAKIHDIREYMQQQGASWYVLSSLDDIAWVLNLRGGDVMYNPLFLSFLIIGPDSMILCVDADKLPDGFADALEGLEITKYSMVEEVIRKRCSGRILFDPERTCAGVAEAASSLGRTVLRPDITSRMKARKNPAELAGIEEAHIQDGCAMVNMLYWLDTSWNHEHITELTVAEKLREFRGAQHSFLQESFSPIVGFRSNGAVIHYHVDESTALPINQPGLLIIDSGGQYLGGTTDITRTAVLGEPDSQQRTDYTLVLKGHLALAASRFPEGTRGIQLDTIARRYLWERGMQYFHGTGHGIGHMLCVHEGPGSISPKMIDIPLEQGMVFSNEPGIYRPGQYGIRIENLMYVRPWGDEGFGQFYRWETVTLCPYERKLIDRSLLTREETMQVNEYHQRVFRELSPSLGKDEAAWLRAQTLPLT